MRARVAEKFQAIGLGAGQRVLVAEDDACRVVLKLPEADEAAARAAERGAGNSELLRI